MYVGAESIQAVYCRLRLYWPYARWSYTSAPVHTARYHIDHIFLLQIDDLDHLSDGFLWWHSILYLVGFDHIPFNSSWRISHATVTWSQSYTQSSKSSNLWKTIKYDQPQWVSITKWSALRQSYTKLLLTAWYEIFWKQTIQSSIFHEPSMCQGR